jgi:Fe-S cluster assembly iron-binding protein IscA
MLTVTEGAKQLLKEILTTHSDDPDMGVRLTLKPPGQLGIILDSEAEDDQVIEHEGSKVLLVAPELESALEEVTLDVEDTDEGRKLTVRKE